MSAGACAVCGKDVSGACSAHYVATIADLKIELQAARAQRDAARAQRDAAEAERDGVRMDFEILRHDRNLLEARLGRMLGHLNQALHV